MNLTRLTRILPAAAIALTLVAPSAYAQEKTGSVHGKVINVLGQPQPDGEAKLTKDKYVAEKDAKFVATVPIKDGQYSAKNLPVGDYFIYITREGKDQDRLEVTIKAGEDATLDFDMTRAEYIKGMSPEQVKALEEYKKKNAEVTSANKVVANLNTTLKTVRADLAAAAPTKGDVSKDVTDIKSAVDAKPDESVLWITYGDTLQAQADHLAVEDKKAGKVASTDTDVTDTYAKAVDAYKKGVDLDAASKKPSPGNEAASDNQMGNALAKSGKVPESSAAFEAAVKLDPSKAAMYYKNEAVVLYNAQQSDGALDAANKAIAADPNSPDPYYIKGQILIARSSFDQKTQKLTAPPGCVEAYNKFLQLAPNDPKVPAVQEVLQSLGEKIDTKYKAGKK